MRGSEAEAKRHMKGRKAAEKVRKKECNAKLRSVSVYVKKCVYVWMKLLTHT